MTVFPKILAATASVALGLTAIAVPVAAFDVSPAPATATVTVVQGIPGSVDICVGGKEIASDVPFGKWATRTVSKLRVYKVRVFRSDPRACAGVKLVSRKVELGPGRDVSLVLKLGRPRVVMFENPPLVGRVASAIAPSDYSYAVIRHAARARNVDMSFAVSTPLPPMSSISEAEPDYRWNAGDEILLGLPSSLDMWVSAKRASTGERLVKPKVINLSGNKYHEVYLVGWNKATYKWVVVRRPLEDVLEPI